ncbi:hypothetical protein FRC12_003947 [Ceratobasidium sp. 428]|nr:hypothetical protein FRC12_003947 [Ceratobasidium sp. 428]
MVSMFLVLCRGFAIPLPLLVTGQAWDIEEPRERTLEVPIDDTIQNNSTAHQGLLGSLYGLDLQDSAQSLPERQSAESETYIKHEAADNRHLISNEDLTTVLIRPATLSSTIELPKAKTVQTGEVLPVKQERQFKAIKFDNPGFLLQTRYPVRPLVAETLEQICPSMDLRHIFCPHLLARRPPEYVSRTPLPIQSKGFRFYDFIQTISNIVFSDGAYRYQSISLFYRNYSNNIHQASGGSGSFTFGLGSSSAEFSGTQGSASNEYRDTPQSQSPTREEIVSRLRQQAHELGYDLVRREVRYEAYTPLEGYSNIFPSASSQQPPLAYQSLYDLPSPVPLQPDIFAPSHVQPWDDSQDWNLEAFALETVDTGAGYWTNVSLSGQYSESTEPMESTNSNINFSADANHQPTLLPINPVWPNIAAPLESTTAEQNADFLPPATNENNSASASGASVTGHNTSRLTCNQCSESFSRPYELKDHDYRHTGVKRKCNTASW